jgi:restriction endonuclease Mrr
MEIVQEPVSALIVAPLHLQAFQELINNHIRLWGQIPFFFWRTADIAEYMSDEEIVLSASEAFCILELATESTQTFTVGDWSIDYDFVCETWAFRRSFADDEIVRIIDEQRGRVREALASKLRDLEPREFEILLYELFARLDDFEHVSVQPQTHDGGYEMFVRSTDKITGHQDWILIQAKHQQGPVTVSQVRELIGTLNVESTRHPERHLRGLMVSINPASASAFEAARQSSTSIDFLDIRSIVNLLIENNIGCKDKSIAYSEIDYEFWSSIRG